MSLASFVKRGMFLAAVPVVALISAGPALAAATFGPSRPTFTWAHPATYITFNSITDNPDPSIGDERYFVVARDAASSDHLTYYNSLNVTNGEDVLLRIFFHNNASSNLNLVAARTTAKVTLPSSATTDAVVQADISAANSRPADVWSTMDLTGSQAFTLAYEPGSAQLWTQYTTGSAVSDSIVGSGALIGSGGADGNVPGCSQFSGYVTLKVKVTVPQTPPPSSSSSSSGGQTISTPPKVLPNTGAGDVIGIFTGASAAGTAAHMAVTARRNRR